MLTLCATAMAQGTSSVIIRYVDAQNGKFANPGTSWEKATKSLQGAINELYALLQKDPTKTGRVYVMGQYLDGNAPVPGSGTYTPTESVEQVSTGVLDTSFKLYAGISIYGSFSPESIKNNTFQEDGTLVVPAGIFSPESDEYLKELRPMRPSPSSSSEYQWTFQYPSTLSGNHAANADEDPLVWNETNEQYDQSFPGNSYHVLWFATNGYIDNAKHPNRARGLERESVVDGFVIRDGNALNKSNTDHKHNSYGGGAYMVHNAVVRRCVFTQNAASLRGGAVYMDGGGLVEQCYFNRNQAAGVGITDGYGGAVCIDGDGAVKHSVMDNNAARVGGGLMIGSYDSNSYPATDGGNDTRVSQLNYYRPYAAGCIINNNTTTAEGGGVMLKGGTLNHCTITHNNCVGVDVTYNGRRYGRSGGLYVDGGGLAVNTVCWGNKVDNNKDVQYAAYTINSTATQKPILAYCAFSNTAYTDWSGTSKRSVLTLNTNNDPSTTSSDNDYFPCFAEQTTKQGVIAADKTNTFYASDPFMPIEQDWEPEGYSYLRAQGIQLNDYPDNTNIVQAHIAQDMFGRDYTAKTTLGALVTTDQTIIPATTVDRVHEEIAGDGSYKYLTLFVDPNKGHSVSNTGYGDSWDNPLSSINDALTQLAKWQNAEDTFTDPLNSGTIYDRAQILVKEGELDCSGSAVYGQLRSSTINMLTNVRLYGGFPAALTGTQLSSKADLDVERNPVAYPTRITAEVSADGYEHNACHIINFSNVTHAVVDGFQLYYANAYYDSDVFTVHNKNGAGVICGNTNTTVGSEVEMDNRIRNCVIANCTAEQGSAIYVKSRNENVTLYVENCVIHNNEAKAAAGAATVYATTDSQNPAFTTLNMNHCTIRGNVGYPLYVYDDEKLTVNLKNSAIHANTKAELAAITGCTPDNVLGIKGRISATSSNNMQDVVLPTTTGIVSKFTYSSTDNPDYTYPKFVNPTRNIGVSREGDLTVYGGSPNWMPGNMNPMVNAASDTGMSSYDMSTVTPRTYGGAADIGALEDTNLPTVGKVIYVRDYGTDLNDTDAQGNKRDGSSWSRAINGNCTTYTNKHGFEGYDAELYAEGTALTGLQWAVDEAYYRSLKKTGSSIDYTEKSGIYIKSTPSSSLSSGNLRVSSIDDAQRVEVWVGEGEYLRRKGFFMRDGVDVLGGFPKLGNPGEKERQPHDYYTIIETNTAAEIESSSFDNWGFKLSHETDGFIQGSNRGWSIMNYSSQETGGEPGYATNAIDGDESTLWHTVYSSGDGEQRKSPHYITINFGKLETVSQVNLKTRKYGFTVKVYLSETEEGLTNASSVASYTYPSESATTYNISIYPSVSAQYMKLVFDTPTSSDFVDLREIGINGLYGTEDSYSGKTHDLNGYLYAYEGSRVLTQQYPYYEGSDDSAMERENKIAHGYAYQTKWDGFVIQNGRTQIKHNRDGAAGVALRYNGVIENCVVKNNINKGNDWMRGAGVFCNDGTIINCQITNNELYATGNPSAGGAYGGGIYMRSGVTYNSCITNNEVYRLVNGTKTSDWYTLSGAAVYFENGMFFNNTIYGNASYAPISTGGFFSLGKLRIYNTIIYGNDHKNSDGDIRVAANGSNAVNTFIDHCLMQNTTIETTAGVTLTTSNLWPVSNSPFQDAANKNYRLISKIGTESNPAINTGTENLEDGNGNKVTLPTTDMDYTARIKDCALDIGAYEYNGAYDITPDLTSMPGQAAIYYVTQNGRGNASANSPENAACATKLQKVLDAAGRYIKDHSKEENFPERIIVKLAGDYDKTGFVYTPQNSTVDEDANATGEEVASTYSIIVPRGVELWGGYTDDYTSADDNGFYTKTTTTTAEGTTTTYTDNRDVMKHHTVLSGEFVKDELTVNAYHVVTFTDNVYDSEHQPMTTTAEGNTVNISLKGYAGDRKAVVDGVFIENGMAVGESDKSDTKNPDPDRYGGAAVVTDYAHVRNCIIRNNTALNGGGALCLEPGALVSGCLIELNAATGNDGKGGGIYVQPSTQTANGTTTFDTTKARVLTSTIVNNWAQNDGGGIYFGNDDPNLRANSVVLWQNDSNGELNVSGLLDPFSQTNETGAVEDYPLSYCAVELLRVPGINNIDVSNIMEQGVRFEDYTKDAAYNNDQWTYTDSLGYYDISDYSTLARAGMSYDEYKEMQGTFSSLELRDFAGISRMEDLNKDNDYIEIGARAYNGSLKLEVKDKLIMHRIYVSKQEVNMAYITKLKTLPDNNVYRLQGSSQAYPMHRLDDALEYVREVRKKTKTDDNGTHYTHNNKYFEIFLTKGEYTPLRTAAGQKTNSRGNTFLVPEGVAIYGGLDTKSDVDTTSVVFYGQHPNDTNTLPSGTDMPTIDKTATTDILEARQHYDMNKNSIIEPWEFKNQSQLSGNVVNNNVKQNVFHVVTILADEEYVGGLPTKKADGKTDLDSNADVYDNLSEKADTAKTYRDKGAKVVIDGVEIRDGRALGYEEAAEDTRTFYRGGGILVFGNWTTGKKFKHVGPAYPRAVGYRNIPLEVRNCQFVDNGARLGGAIYSDSEVSIVQSSFVQNFAEGKTETVPVNGTDTPIPYSGRGGALNLSYEASIVNTIFANNEARRASTDATNEGMGWGGAVSMGDYAALNMLNCDVVKNKAVAYPAIYLFKANQGGDVNSATEATKATLKADNPTKIVNTVFWGNVTEDASQRAEHQKVVNYRTDDPSDNSTDKTDAETLWFCAYEQDKGLTPHVLSTDEVDLRSVEYKKDTYIPYAWKSLEKTDGSTYDAHDKTNNIIISSQNEVTGGPNFIKPSTIAGCDGYDVSADWMIGRINNLVDNGWTYLQQNSKKDGYDKVTKTGYTEDVYDGSGIYWTVTYDILGDDLLPIGEDQYMSYANAAAGSSDDDQRIKRISNDPNPTHEQSYIDIGVYEYQHQVLKPAEVGDLDLLWVTDQEQSGVKADGKTFATASSDLQRAIETLLSYRNGHRKEIRLLAGEYQPVYTLNGNLGFTIDTEHVNVSAINGVSDDNYHGVASLTIQGGWSKEVKGQYNVDAYPAYIYSSQRTGVSDDDLAHVFVINNAQQIETSTPSGGGNKTHRYTDHVMPITLEGIVFCNVIGKVHKDLTDNTKTCRGGAAVYYKDQYDVKLKSGDDRTNTNVEMDANGKAVRSTTELLKAPETNESLKNHCPSNLLDNKLTIRQCGFRFNSMNEIAIKDGIKNASPNPLPAVTIGKGGGKTLIYNSVFHTNGGDALVATGTRVVNCTFAQNYGNVKFYDHSTNPSEMHNSLLWLNHRFKDEANRSSVQWTDNQELLENPENPSISWTNDAAMAATNDQNYFTYNAATTLPNTNDYIDGTSGTAYNMYLSETNDDVINGPNFVNPMDGKSDLLLSNLRDLAARNYNLQPGVKTVGRANPYLYVNKVYGAEAGKSYDMCAGNCTQTITTDKNGKTVITVTHKNQQTVAVAGTGDDTSGRGPNESVKTYLKYVNVHKDNTEVSGTMEPSDMENATLRADKDDYTDKDKGYYDRYYGSRGMELGAYECIASISDVMYYDPHLTAEGDGSSWERAYPQGQLNKALMAAAVAAAGGNKAYVFAHGTNLDTKTNEYVTMYDGVRLIGGLKQSFKKQHNDWKDAGETTKMYPTTESFVATAIYERQGVAGDEANPTIVQGVKAAPNVKKAYIDGIVISNDNTADSDVALTTSVIDFTQGNGMVLTNCIVRDNKMGTDVPLIALPTGENKSLMYNVLLRGNTTGSSSGTTSGLYMVNGTVADGSITASQLAGSHNNIFDTKETTYAPYFNPAKLPYTLPKTYSKDLWYQLVEGSNHINNGDDNFLSSEAVFAPANAETSKAAGIFNGIIDYDNDLDLLGNPRRIGTQVDNGCYETWSTSYLDDNNVKQVEALTATAAGGVTIDYVAGNYSLSNYGGNEYPHPGSVVYLDDGALTLKKADSSLSFTSASPMTAGYLLVKNGGSLYGQGNHVSLDYVAVEKSQAQYALVSLPFAFKAENDGTYFKTITTTTGNKTFTPVTMGNGLYAYSGEKRAQWGYNFKKSSSDCWEKLDYDAVRTANEGFLFDRGTGAAAAALRYTGTGTAVYTEGGDDKKVVLEQHDDNTSTDGGSDFTSVYNMGWNLKGMPYLISNYPSHKVMDDGTYAMNVPHVIYNMDDDGSYITRQSWTDGCTLSPGDAFFTQTATVNADENLRFSLLLYTTSATPSPAKRKAVGVVLSAGEKSSPSAVLLPSEPSEGDLRYTVNRDGAKFMSMDATIPEIAVCGAAGVPMSLVGAAPVETEMALATSVPEDGLYTISLDRNQDWQPGVTAVWLKDNQKGKVVDLLKEDYVVEMDADVEPEATRSISEVKATYGLRSGRFTVKLGGLSPEDGKADGGTQWKISVDNLHLTVSGLGADTYVSVYSPDGIVRYSGTSSLGIFETDVLPGIYIIRAEGKSRKIVCRTN